MEPGYELIRKIAGGGMGEVFIARRTGTANFEKRVALKLLLPHLADSPETVRHFHEEARLAARMHHPNIVEIFDVGEADGRPFIAMQLVDGVTLSRLLRDVTRAGSRVPLPLVRLIATGLCEALSYAHGLVDGKGRPLRVVHRDVTPGNVLVSRNGAVLLTDFGIALARDSSKTEPGVLKGKAAYMAPEQVRLDRRIDARTDIYALAMTLYELLTGTNPYRKPTMKESLAALEHSRLEPVETLRSDVGERMAKALHQALEHDPERRFPTARAFREAFVDGPVATAPDLADFVKFHCVDTPSEPALEDSSGPATRSVVVTVTPAKPPRLTRPDRPRPAAAPAPRRGLVAAAVLALLSLGGGLAWWSSSQTPVPPPAPTAAPLEPPPEEAAPTETPPPHEPAAVPVEPVAAQRPEPKEDPAPRPVRHPRPPPLPAKMRVGYLSADASPWAEVELNGQVLDRTPFARFPVPAGKHQVVFHGPGGKTVTRTVQISEGAVSALRVDF